QLLHRSDVKLYRDTRALPRAYVVGRAISTPSHDAALAALGSEGHDPRSATVVERAPLVPPPSASLRGAGRRVIDGAFAWLGIERAPVPGGLEEGRALPTAGASVGDVTWVEDTPERIVVRVSAPQGGYLVLRDTYFPGWSATVDGRSAELLRADTLFRAVPLTASSTPQEVVMTFRSRPFERGALLSGLAVFLTLALAFVRRLPFIA
ncbi:MAG TPA: hypothetical protein VFN74_25170, partial [Chloroflexota bacterium]|nr:hypothetical protein [Chloroflexota bacterium]